MHTADIRQMSSKEGQKTKEALFKVQHNESNILSGNQARRKTFEKDLGDDKKKYEIRESSSVSKDEMKRKHISTS